MTRLWAEPGITALAVMVIAVVVVFASRLR